MGLQQPREGAGGYLSPVSVAAAHFTSKGKESVRPNSWNDAINKSRVHT